MILKNLTLCDFGLFQGRHSFDLTPRQRYGRKCPIVLFGGLNGTGKTTLLTAIRLAFYGKQSFGPTMSKKTYHQTLTEAIHKGRHDLIVANAAAIELTFTYARQGEINEYYLRRAWNLQAGDLEETLTIAKDGQPLKEFSIDLCQAFLNELIPIGVSELFFFDGEKIAELADDDTGDILQQAVRKLLGLDLIERLRNDLAIYLQGQKQVILPAAANQEIQTLETELQVTLANKDNAIATANELRRKIKALQKDIQQLENLINDGGGAYAKTRQDEQQNQARLLAEKTQLENQLKDLLGEAFPLSLVPKSLAQLLKQLEKEAEWKKQRGVGEILSPRLQQLNAQIAETLPKKYTPIVSNLIEETFADLLSSQRQNSIRHDFSDTVLAKFQHWIQTVIPQSAKSFAILKKRWQAVQEEIEQVSVRLERAPATSSLKIDLATLKKKMQQLGEWQAQAEQQLEQARSWLREAMELVRKIQQLQAQKSQHWRDHKALVYANNARNLLEEFSQRTAHRRLQELEDEFIQAFHRLSRKEDVPLQAKIDPDTFMVSLLDDQGHRISKHQLSAGEKQIYAIAILEALARTSGRKLPIIIDTPLGRLDSKHRSKLVKYYFPQASHQVVILSTDTEVDREFYQSLSTDISHAYHLQYDSIHGNAFAHPGYFWRIEQAA